MSPADLIEVSSSVSSLSFSLRNSEIGKLAKIGKMSSCNSHVRIKGLKSETGKTLNGSIGLIIEKVTGKDGKMRFKVKVRERTFALRKENLGT